MDDFNLDLHFDVAPSHDGPRVQVEGGRISNRRRVLVPDDAAKYWIIFNMPIRGSGRRLVISQRQAPDDAPGILGVAAPGRLKTGHVVLDIYSYHIRVMAKKGDDFWCDYVDPYSDLDDPPTEAQIADAMAKAASVKLYRITPRSSAHCVAETTFSMSDNTVSMGTIGCADDGIG